MAYYFAFISIVRGCIYLAANNT